MKNQKIIIEYLYRDAGNNKLFVEDEIENPKNLTFTVFEKWFRDQLIDGLFFVPSDFGLLKPQFPSYNPDLDHDWCELICLRKES